MFKDNKILILGMARSGYEAAKYLAKRGNTIILNDGGSKDKQDKDKIKELEELGVTLIFDTHPDDLDLASFDYIWNGFNTEGHGEAWYKLHPKTPACMQRIRVIDKAGNVSPILSLIMTFA